MEETRTEEEIKQETCEEPVTEKPGGDAGQAEPDEETAQAGPESEEPKEAEEPDKEEPKPEKTPNVDDVSGKSQKADSQDEQTEKKSFFKKKDKKDKKDVQIDELTDKLRRQMAEFDNYRKRTDKEKSAMYEVGARSVIEKFLPVVDSFERGLKSLDPEEAKTPFAEGMDKIYKQLLATLDQLEVKPIEAVGQPFDPALHNAVMHVEDEEVGENIIVEEFQKGYTYRDSVIRHSMVKVAN